MMTTTKLSDMLSKLRGRFLYFVGDSVVEQQFMSLACAFLYLLKDESADSTISVASKDCMGSWGESVCFRFHEAHTVLCYVKAYKAIKSAAREIIPRYQEPPEHLQNYTTHVNAHFYSVGSGFVQQQHMRAGEAAMDLLPFLKDDIAIFAPGVHYKKQKQYDSLFHSLCDWKNTAKVKGRIWVRDFSPTRFPKQNPELRSNVAEECNIPILRVTELARQYNDRTWHRDIVHWCQPGVVYDIFNGQLAKMVNPIGPSSNGNIEQRWEQLSQYEYTLFKPLEVSKALETPALLQRYVFPFDFFFCKIPY